MGLTKTGAGTLTLAGANDYSGDTTIAAGTLLVGMPPRSAVAPATAMWKSTERSTSTPTASASDGLTGAGTITTSASGTATLTVGANDQTSQFDGLICDGSAVVTLTKIGSGTLTVTGASTYSGGTTIVAGTLRSATEDGRCARLRPRDRRRTLELDALDGEAMTNAISGAGHLVKLGVGTLDCQRRRLQRRHVHPGRRPL